MQLGAWPPLNEQNKKTNDGCVVCCETLPRNEIDLFNRSQAHMKPGKRW